MGYYPIFVQMEGRRVLLVGGGNVAHEKLGRLVDAEAAVTVVAPELIPEVRAFVEAGRAAWQERSYKSGDVEGYEVVMVATDDRAVNARVLPRRARSGSGSTPPTTSRTATSFSRRSRSAERSRLQPPRAAAVRRSRAGCASASRSS